MEATNPKQIEHDDSSWYNLSVKLMAVVVGVQPMYANAHRDYLKAKGFTAEEVGQLESGLLSY